MKISKTMKKILLVVGLLVCLTAAHFVFAQAIEGTIHYEVKVNLHRRIPADRQEMKNMVPEFNIYKEQLFFNASESLYKPVEEEEDDEFAGMRMRIRRPQTEFYVNQSSGKRMRQLDFMGKKYLIEDSIKILPWKLGTEEKTIHGYACKQATYYNETSKQTVVAWYTDKLRPFLGPEGYHSLPGTVLQVDINDGERVLTATKVETRNLKKAELKVPSSGQRITDQDYQKMMQEQMQRMGAQGGVIIRN
jgi:GLPGLI family protein